MHGPLSLRMSHQGPPPPSVPPSTHRLISHRQTIRVYTPHDGENALFVRWAAPAVALARGRGPLVRVRAGTGLLAINQMRPDAVPLGSCRPVWGPGSSDRESRVPYRAVTSVWMGRFNYSSLGKSRTFVRMSEKSRWTYDDWKMDFKGLG